MNISFLDGYTVVTDDSGRKKLEALGNLSLYDRTQDADVISRAKGADVVIVNKTALNESHFSLLSGLKLVCVAATGYDRIDVEAAARHGVTVCNCAGYSSRSVAQIVASFVLEVADSVGEYTRENRNGRWCKSPDFCYTLRNRIELVEKTMAIVGFGNIGQAVADVMRPFGVKLFAVTSKRQDELPVDVEKISLGEAFRKCQFVSLNCPLTADNKEFVNSELLQSTNSDLVLINTARGGLVNEHDVAQALRDGRIAAYCTDVLTIEPAQSDCPLLAAPNLYITPHIGWDTPEARMRIINILVENIQNFFAGNPTNCVTK